MVARLVQPPAGTVTFLFSDIEGSTRLWESEPEAMAGALARHDALLRAAIESNRGFLVKTTGDGLFAVFGSARDAVVAAVEGQLALGSEPWDVATPVRARMGLHTGEAVFEAGDYHGPAVNRTARLTSAGFGGQILLSAATTALVQDRLPDGVELTDLGQHRLRDLGRPEALFQVLHAELGRTFPPLRSLGAVPGNLTPETSSFIGRQAEVAVITATLERERVVTLTGVGGVGKTRLALQVGEFLRPGFRDGAWLVELAGLQDPAAVVATVSATLGLPDRSARPAEEALGEFLGGKELLLILDNCEHLLDEVAAVVEALQHACPGVRVLATSREGLGVAGERIFPVPSLRGAPVEAGPEAALESEAVALFVERAGAVDPAFSLTAVNTGAVVQVCRRLDGIPLAIELAAARSRAMTITELAHGLERRFDILAGGSRRAVKRHQTLRAAVDWSYDLLDEDEARLLARLAVFAGGCTRAAAEAVCGFEPLDTRRVLGLLASLVAKSLVVAQRDEPESRYRLLETIREYAEERLGALGETEALRAAHSTYYGETAAAYHEKYFGPEQVEAIRFLMAEQENLLVAFNRALETGDLDLGLGLARSTANIGDAVAHQVSFPLEAMLGLPGAADHPLYPSGLGISSFRAAQIGDFAGAQLLVEEAMAAARRLGVDIDEGIPITRMTMQFGTGAWPEFAEEARGLAELARTSGRTGILAVRLASVAMAHTIAGEADTAVPFAEESLELARHVAAPRTTAFALISLAGALAARDPARARASLRQGIRLLDEIGVWGPTDATQSVLIGARIEDWALVFELGPRALRQVQWDGDLPLVVALLTAVARALAPLDDAAAILLGAARRLAKASLPMSSRPSPEEGTRTEGAGVTHRPLSLMTGFRQQASSLLRQRLPESRILELRAQGEEMDPDAAVACALDAIARTVPGRV